MVAGDAGCIGGYTIFTKVNHKYDPDLPENYQKCSNIPDQDLLQWINEWINTTNGESEENDIIRGMDINQGSDKN